MDLKIWLTLIVRFGAFTCIAGANRVGKSNLFDGDEEKVYAQAANRLSELLDDVDKVWVDRDDRICTSYPLSKN